MPVVPKKILVCIIVYDRIKNLNLWLTAWKSCQQHDSKIAVIHNYDGEIPQPEYKHLCDMHSVDFYCPRHNKGYDIGALQDLQRKRLSNHDLNNYEFDLLFWSVDDCLPLDKLFMFHFLDKICQDKCGLCGVQISNECSKHLRTNTFIIKKELFNDIKFPADPIHTKSECYEFEHRGLTLTKQIEKAGFLVEQVHPLFHKYFWDINHHRQLKLWNKFYHEFPECVGAKP